MGGMHENGPGPIVKPGTLATVYGASALPASPAALQHFFPPLKSFLSPCRP